MWVLIFSGINDPLFSQNKPSTSLEYFALGMAHFKKNELKPAISAFKQATILNPDYAEAFYRLACADIATETIDGRIKATFALKKALRLDDKNVNYNIAMGRLLLQQKLWVEAASQFKRALELDSLNSQALYRLGRLAMKDMYWYKDTVSPHQDITFTFEKQAQENFDRAIRYFKAAISCDSNAILPCYYLAFLYFENGDTFAAKALLHKTLLRHNKNSRLYHILGMIYPQKHEFNQANKYFNRALALLPPDKIRKLQATGGLLTRQQQALYAAADDSTNLQRDRNFWASSDPLLLTDINERQLEHYCRLTYIELRYGDIEKGDDGLQSQRGKTFLRFGPAKNIVRKRASLALDSQGYRSSKLNNILVPTREQWQYEDFSLTFSDQYMRDNFTFERTFEPNEDSKIQFEKKIAITPQIWHMFDDTSILTMPFITAQFKGNAGRTRLEVYFGLPAKQMTFQRRDDRVIANFQRGLFLFNAQGDNFSRPKSRRQVPLLTVRNPQNDEYILDRIHCDLPSATHRIIIEIRDDFSGNYGRITQVIAVRDFPDSQLTMSDIVLADKIDEHSSSIYGLGKFEIIPNIYHTFNADSIISIYFEIYNLQTDAQDKTNYAVEIMVHNLENKEPAIVKFLRNIGELLGKKPAYRGEIGTRYNFAGNSATAPVSLSFLLAKGIPATYAVTIRTTDRIAKTVAESSVKFTLSE